MFTNNNIKMYCNDVIHNELKDMGEVTCDFCYEKIVDDTDEIVRKETYCCNNIELINDN